MHEGQREFSLGGLIGCVVNCHLSGAVDESKWCGGQIDKLSIIPFVSYPA